MIKRDIWIFKQKCEKEGELKNEVPNMEARWNEHRQT